MRGNQDEGNKDGYEEGRLEEKEIEEDADGDDERITIKGDEDEEDKGMRREIKKGIKKNDLSGGFDVCDFSSSVLGLRVWDADFRHRADL